MTQTIRNFVLCCGIGGVLAGQSAPPNNYLVHNLVSDLPGLADHQDTRLKNPWGNGFGSTPFWIGNNGSGTSTLYDGTGAALATVVSIPQAAGKGTTGPVTGVVFNSFSSNTSAFQVAAGKPASFMFCSQDGVIARWNASVDAANAKILVDNSKSGAVYDGCALGGTAAAPFIFAANFNAGTVDVFDAGLNPVTSGTHFANAAIPAGFAPFNVHNIGGTLFVLYAQQDSAKKKDVAGAGNGYVAMFDLNGNLIRNLISQGALNSPWGIAMAPATFGAFGGALLVGNFGDGTVNAFDPVSGKQSGTLSDLNGKPIVIPGLWSIDFGSGARSEDPGTLYFTAGIGDGPNNANNLQTHGLLGSIQGPPVFTTANILNGASLLAGPVSQSTWIAIKGNALSATTGTWKVTGPELPTEVNGVGVKVAGTAVPVNFVSNTQINALVTGAGGLGNVSVQVTNNGLTSAVVQTTFASLAPGFFPLGTAGGKQYIAATHADGTYIGPPGLVAGLTTTPAKSGETIAIYGTGFGATLSGQPDLLTRPVIVIDGYVADVQFAGLVGPGLYQFNVTVPATAAIGDDFVIALLSNSETQPAIFLPVAQ